MSGVSQFNLLRTQRFLPLFVTQFLGAFNDNLLKNAVVVLINFHGMHMLGLPAELMIQLTAALFILPFFLFRPAAARFAKNTTRRRSHASSRSWKSASCWLPRWVFFCKTA